MIRFKMIICSLPRGQSKRTLPQHKEQTETDTSKQHKLIKKKIMRTQPQLNVVIPNVDLQLNIATIFRNQPQR